MSDESPGLSYERDIKPLFRPSDRERMEFAFDLWEYDDVKDAAPQILERLQDGDMPCDGEWPADQVDMFREWIDSGMRP
jgi:hypothetical protein